MEFCFSIYCAFFLSVVLFLMSEVREKYSCILEVCCEDFDLRERSYVLSSLSFQERALTDGLHLKIS